MERIGHVRHLTGGRSGGKQEAAKKIMQAMFGYWEANHEICIHTMGGVVWNLETGEVSTS